MRRQIAEKIVIEERGQHVHLMNSKNEWGGDPLPRIILNTENEEKNHKEEDEKEE